MNSGFKSQSVPSYRLLDEAQIKQIHYATLDLLENSGVKVMDEEAIDMGGLSKELQDYVKTAKVVLGQSLYSDSWLDL